MYKVRAPIMKWVPFIMKDKAYFIGSILKVLNEAVHFQLHFVSHISHFTSSDTPYTYHLVQHGACNK